MVPLSMRSGNKKNNLALSCGIQAATEAQINLISMILVILIAICSMETLCLQLN